MHPYVSIFYPAITLVLMTYVVAVALFRGWTVGMRRHRARMQELTDNARFEEIFKTSETIAENFENLFEIPVLFYFFTVVVFVTGTVDPIYLWGSWIFVATRAVHSWIHCTSNQVPARFAAYATGALLLLSMWVRLAAQLLA